MTKNELLPASKLFQTEVAAAEKVLVPMVARLLREMTSTVDDKDRFRRRVRTDIRDSLQLSRQVLGC